MDWIAMTNSNGECGSGCIRVGAVSGGGHERLGHQPAQVDLDRTEHGEFEIEESDDLAVPQRVHQCEVTVVDDLFDEGRCSVVSVNDLVQPGPLRVREIQRSTDTKGRCPCL